MAKDNVTRMPRRKKGDDGEEEQAALQSERAGARHAKAPEVAKIAEQLIPSPGLGLKQLENSKIAYIFTSAKTIGCNGFVQTRLWPAWARPYGKFDFLILVSKFQWDSAPERTREAAIAHALSHCFITEKGVPQRHDHDYEDFGTVAKRYGAWSEGGRIVQLRLLERGEKPDAWAAVEQRSERERLATEAAEARAQNGNGQQAAD